MLIVVHIHNNSLGECIAVESTERGIEIIHQKVEEKLNRTLTEDELNAIENDREFFDESDSDNIWCYAIGMVESDCNEEL
jgi:hypothetical protein